MTTVFENLRQQQNEEYVKERKDAIKIAEN
jgi:hypothetical protein